MDNIIDALEQRPLFFPCLFSALLLIVGIGRWPNSYYTMVYWVTMIIPTGVALICLLWRQWKWVPGLLVMALAFQPIVHISFGATIWKTFDAVGGAYMLVVALAVKKPGGAAKKETDSGLALPVAVFVLSLAFMIYAFWKL